MRKRLGGSTQRRCVQRHHSEALSWMEKLICWNEAMSPRHKHYTKQCYCACHRGEPGPTWHKDASTSNMMSSTIVRRCKFEGGAACRRYADCNSGMAVTPRLFNLFLEYYSWNEAVHAISYLKINHDSERVGFLCKMNYLRSVSNTWSIIF